MGPLLLLIGLVGLVDARFEHLHPSFSQVFSKLSAGEPVSSNLLTTRAAEWKRLYKIQPEEAFRVADLTQTFSALLGKGFEYAMSGIGSVTTTCSSPQLPPDETPFSNRSRPAQLSDLAWSPFENQGDRCFQSLTLGDMIYMLRLSLEHPLRNVGDSLIDIPIHGYVIPSSTGSPEFFARTTPFHSLTVKETGEIGLHVGTGVLKFKTLAEREKHLTSLNAASVWSQKTKKEQTTKRRLRVTGCSSSTSTSTNVAFGEMGTDRIMCVARYTLTDGLPIKDRSGATITDAMIHEQMAKINAFFRQNSYQQFEFSETRIYNVQGTVAPGTLNTNLMRTEWRNANPGVWCNCDAEYIIFNYNMGGYQIPWAGLATLNYQGGWLNGDITPRVWAHEIGHNVGFGHSRQYALTAESDTWMGPGIVYEYGDPYDLMGGGAADMTVGPLVENDVAYFGTLYRSFIQATPWIPSNYVLQVAPTAGQSLDVILWPCDMGTSTPALTGTSKLAVHYVRPSEISQSMTTAGTVGGGTSTETIKFGRFFFEYKTKLKSVQGKQGLIVHGAALSASTMFGINLDNNPQTTATADSPLSFGNTFSDCPNGVHITSEKADCPGGAAQGCAKVMIRNGLGGVNIGLAVTDQSTGQTSSSVNIGVSVTLQATLSGYNTATKPTSVYFDWGDGAITMADANLRGAHSWTTEGMKIVTVTATTLESAYTKILYKVKVGESLNIARIVTSDTTINSDSAAVGPVGNLMINSTKSGFTVTMMVRFTNTNQLWHEFWRMGSWLFYSQSNSGLTYGYYFIQNQGSASSGPAPFFNKVAQAAYVVQKTGSTATVDVYVDGTLYQTHIGVTTAWPTSTAEIKVGSYSNNNRYVGGVVSKVNVYNWALTAGELALDATGTDLLNMAQASGGSTSGCTAAAPSSATPPSSPTISTIAPTRAPATNAPTTPLPTSAPTPAPTRMGCTLPNPFPAGYTGGATTPCTAGGLLAHGATCNVACIAGTPSGTTAYGCTDGVRSNPTLTCAGTTPSQVLLTLPTATGFTVTGSVNSGLDFRVNIATSETALTLTNTASFWSATVGTLTKQLTSNGAVQSFAFTGLTTGTRYCAKAAATVGGSSGSSSALVASSPSCITVGNRCTLPTTTQPGWDQSACPLGSTVDNTFTCTISCSLPFTARTGTTQYICDNGGLTVPSLVCNTNAPSMPPTTARPTMPPAAPTCYDGIRNGNELAVDCGGPDCGPCACGVVVVEEAVPSPTPRALFGTYLLTGQTENSRPVYQHITSKLYLYSRFISPDTYWLIGSTTSTYEAYTLSVANTAQAIAPGSWTVGTSIGAGTALPQLSTRCQTFNETSECNEVRIDGRIGTASYVNGIWINQNAPYGGHPTYKHSSLALVLYWSSNSWNIADVVASSSVIAKRASHALDTYIPFTQGYSFDQPWNFLSGSNFVADPEVTSWCLGCIGISVNGVSYLAQSTYFGNHEMYRAVGQSNMFVFTHGGWALVATTFAGYTAPPTPNFVRAPAASSTRLITGAPFTGTFCTIPASPPVASDACYSLSCSACLANSLCQFCATGSDVGQQRCLSLAIPCSGTTSTLSNCPNVDNIPRSCGPLISPQNAMAATCDGTLGSVCTFACATGYVATGSTTRTCQTSPATWDGTPLSCAPRACPTVNAPTGGVSVPSACTGKVEGDTCSFECNTGYVGTGAYTITCRNGAWVGTPLTCAKMPCPTITSGPNSVSSTCAGKVHGDSCVFSCAAGFSPPSSTLECVAGTWVGKVAQCASTPCPPLSNPYGALVASCIGKSSGDVCTFACSTGFTAAGSTSRTCTNGEWSGTPLTCTAPNTCPSLTPPFPGSNSQPCNGIAASGTCTHTCEPGYTQGGDSVRTCGTSLTWSGTPLTCTPRPCPTLASPPGAVTASCSGKVEGDTCTFVCAAGYQATNNQATRTCSNQAWGGTDLHCALKVCPDLNPPPNAVQTPCTQTLDQETCSWVCNVGYAPKTYSIFCLDGIWANIPPLQCVQTTCPDLLPPLGGTGAACIGVTHGGTCTFGCSAGLTPNGFAQRTCQDGVWSGEAFTCTGPTACPALESPPGALTATCSAKQLGESCSFTCDVGYVTASGDNTRLCGTGRVWSGNALQCAPKTCFDLPSPLNAVPRTCSNMIQGQTCLHQCNSESTPLGNTLRTCVNGAWDGVPLQCSLKVCPGLTAPLNSAQFGASCQGYSSREVCVFSCLPGTITVGDPSRTCLQGAWTGDVLQCVPAATRYVWSGSSWGPCSASCGPASQTRTVDCVDLFNGTLPVHPDNCADQHPADSIQDCANPACQAFNWINGTWGQCTQACGGGQSQRTVQCQATIGTGALATTAIVADDQCSLPVKPASVQTCNVDACNTSTWSATLWSPCSAQCGGGTQERVVTCLDANLNSVPESNCSLVGPKPLATQACNTERCLSYHWKVCGLDKCTAPCNGGGTGLGMIGYQYREIFCLRNTDSRRVDESLCQAMPKPTEFVEGCNGFPCSANYWMTTRWTACNATGTNGEGTRERTYHCHFADGRNALNSDCPQDQIPPIVESCNINVCRGEAFTVAGPVAEPILSAETGMYIGIGAGILFALLAGGALTWWCVRRNQGSQTTKAKKQMENEMVAEEVALPKSFGKPQSAKAMPASPSSRPAPPSRPGGLPYGWSEMHDGDGNTYYENSETGETTWDRPS